MSIAKFTKRVIKGGTILRDVDNRLKRAKDFTPALRKSAEAAQNSVRDEFLGTYWKSPSGSNVEWANRKDNENHPLLVLSGDLFLDWTEGAPNISNKSFSIGSDKDYSIVQRGGSGNDVSTSPLWNNIPPRPHGTHNPELDENIRLIISNFIAFGTL